MRATLETFADHHQLLDYLYHILVELSSSAVGFHKLTSWWTLVNRHKYTLQYMIGPICWGRKLRPSTSAHQNFGAVVLSLLRKIYIPCSQSLLSGVSCHVLGWVCFVYGEYTSCICGDEVLPYRSLFAP